MKTENINAFRAALIAAYAELFKTSPEYAYSASKTTPEGLADRMIEAVLRGSANITGPGFRMACKACGINHTGKAIDAFLGIEAPAKTAKAPKPPKNYAAVLNNIEAAMTGVFQVNYTHGLAVLTYTDGSREAANVTPAEWLATELQPFRIVSLVQSKRVPAQT